MIGLGEDEVRAVVIELAWLGDEGLLIFGF
jgi:hypothetical protein